MTCSSFPSIQNILPEQTPQTSFNQLPKTESILFQGESTKMMLKKVILPSKTLNQHFRIYEWRNSIKKRIVQCSWTCILPLDQENVIIQVQNKFYPYTLKNIHKTSLTQLIHILKEALKGFEILYEKFGGFKINDECLFIDQNYEIEVWGSKEPWNNAFDLKQESQNEFLCDILKLFQSHEIRSKLTKKFNEGLQRYDQLTFAILKAYIEGFINQNQLVVGSQKSLKQIFLYSKGIGKLNFNYERNEQNNLSLTLIQNGQKQGILPKSGQNLLSPQNSRSQKEIFLQFSSSKKIKKKGTNLISGIRSENALKQSDLTTQATQNLSGSREQTVCKESKSMEKQYVVSFAEKSQFTDFQFRSQSRKKIKETELSGKKTVKYSNQNLKVTKKNIKQQGKNKKGNVLGSSLRDTLDNYTRQALSGSQVEDNQENSCIKSDRDTDQKLFKGNKLFESEQDEVEERSKIDFIIFKQKLDRTGKFYESIDSLADSKRMVSSIQMKEQGRKKSAIKLNKLSNIKSDLYESIIEQDFTSFERQF